MKDLRALAWITGSLVQRLLREPQVVRSLLWPIALGPITVVLTVLVWVWLEGEWPVAIDPTTGADIVELLEAERWVPILVPDAREAVASGAYNLGTDGHTVFAARDRGRTLELERILRNHHGAPWMPGRPAALVYDPTQGAKLTGVLGFLFVLFGVVFGAAMVARDRDDGTLEAEVALGIRRCVHGAARWLAGSFVLSLHFLLAIAVVDALMGIQDVWALIRLGTSACSASVAIGLLVIGRGGLSAGFSGPLAGGIAIATALASLGLTALPGTSALPIATLISGGDGWLPLGVSVVLAIVAIAVFTHRSARA